MRTSLFICLFLFVFTVSSQTVPGKFTGYTQERNGVTLHADTVTIRLHWYAPDILRVDMLPSPDAAIDSTFAVIQQPIVDASFTVTESGTEVVVASSSIRVRCTKDPLRLTFSDSTGRALLAEPATGGMSWSGPERRLRFAMKPDAHFYGTGERGTSLDKRGEKFESWNTQVPGYGTPLATMNLNVPFLATPNGYALYIDNAWKGVFDLGASDTSSWAYTAEGGELSFYFIAAPDVPAQLERYTWLTGRQPLPPRWAFGFIQSKNRYENEEEARSVVKTMRDKRIPCDALVLDLKWFEKMGDVSWNEQLWPHHDQMVKDFLTKGMKTILITEPYIVQTSKNFPEADTRGFLAKDSSGHTYLMDRWWSCLGACSASLLDITNPDAAAWWWDRQAPAFGKEVAGIWTDLGEPERHPLGMMHAMGSAAKVHNIYNLLWARTVWDGFRAIRPGERVVNLTRSGSAGIQRYGVLPWSGDVARSFGGLEVQLPMLLNMGMSGIAYHNSDIGGYSRMPSTPELYVRWMQYGTFCPIARAHGAGETVQGYPTEPWMFGAEAETICRKFISLRYRLLPYIYTMAHRNYETGMPLARALFWSYPADTVLANESSSYLWGDAFLVSPVVNGGAATKDVYLPLGTWIDYWTDDAVQGGTVITIATPLDRMPLFVKAGSIIPMAQPMQYSDEHAMDTLTLRVYPLDSAEASFTLYEDDGHTLAYQSGEYAETKFTQRFVDGAKRTRVLVLTADKRKGTFAGALDERVYLFEVHHCDGAPLSVHCAGAELPERTGSDLYMTKGNGYFYNPAAQTLLISVLCRSDESYEVTAKLQPGVN